MLSDFASDVDMNVIRQLEKFWIKINERTLYKMGAIPEYDPEGDDALGMNVEFFHFSICADDRMKYLGQNVVLVDSSVLSDRNKLCNALIAHFYGGRRIHTLMTGITDPRKAHVDFQRISDGDQDYVESIRGNAQYAWSHGYKFYGTTELHTSLQTAARNFCRVKYGDPARLATNVDIIEWVASWIDTGLIDDLIHTTPTLAEAYRKITSQPGIGPYYGYHGAVDCSLFHATPYRHDEFFCVPGPGCQETMRMVFPSLSKQKKFPYGEAVVWIAKNYQSLFPSLPFSKELWNIEIDGKKMFPFEQDRLMTYGCEVGTCQFGVYKRLKANPHLIEKRLCGSDPDLTPIEMREKGNPIPPPVKASKKKQNQPPPVTSCLLEF